MPLSAPERTSAAVSPPVSTQSAPGLSLLNEAPELSADQNATAGDWPTSQCRLYGAVTSPGVADTLRSALAETGVMARVIVEDRPLPPDYWVYIPMDPNSRVAGRAVQALKHNGIPSFVFAEGDLAGTVAAGIFSNVAEAEAQQQTLSEMGYSAELAPVPRAARTFWLAVSPEAEGHLEAFDWGRYYRGEITTKIVKKPCETVASIPHIQ